MATVKENLIAAKALIDTPEKWIKGELSKNGCYCALGAVQRASNYNVRTKDALYDALPDVGIMTFNDDPNTTHSDIMALFDRAIAAEESKEARA